MTVIRTGPARSAGRDTEALQDKNWGVWAACREVGDLDLFFPLASATLQLEQAKSVCRQCPVREECLQDALDAPADYGVRGGLSEEERRALHGRSVTGAERPETPRRAWEIAAAPQEYLRLVGEGLSPYQVSRALRTNMQTINEVTRLLAEQEQGAQAPVEAGA